MKFKHFFHKLQNKTLKTLWLSVSFFGIIEAWSAAQAKRPVRHHCPMGLF